MKTTTRLAAVSLAVLTLGLAGAVSAHSGYGMGQGMGQGMGPGAGAGSCMGYGPGAAASAADGAGAGAGGCAMGPGMGHGMHGGMHGGMRGGMRAGMAGPQAPADVTARLSDLKTELKITDAQEGAWQAFTAASQQQAEQRFEMHTQMQSAAPADRAAHYEAMKAVREAQFAARSKALTDLYAVLTPEQKALADQQLRGRHGQGMAMRGHKH